MVLADFVITVEFGEPREVRVVVYDSLKGMRIAASRYDNITVNKRKRKRNKFSQTLGICHRFEWFNEDGLSKPQCAIVRLARPYLGVGMVAHELTHAAVWMRELNGETGPLTSEDDEEFVWLVGELVRQGINAMNERGVYAE